MNELPPSSESKLLKAFINQEQSLEFTLKATGGQNNNQRKELLSTPRACSSGFNLW